MDTKEKINESNRIEGINRECSIEEVNEYGRFISLDRISLNDVINFVKIYQPNARLRNKVGLDVRIGDHLPIRGGMRVESELIGLIELIDKSRISAYDAHIQYEILHPFTDGNGRSGRMIWYWMMRYHRFYDLGFLHGFYYQTLNDNQSNSRLKESRNY